MDPSQRIRKIELDEAEKNTLCLKFKKIPLTFADNLA